jgi:aryl-alcohol dehydrogenase-like predicted oxidoreductase
MGIFPWEFYKRMGRMGVDATNPGMYNAITRSLEQELIPACKRYGLDVVIYNPLAGGIFGGAYTSCLLPFLNPTLTQPPRQIQEQRYSQRGKV